jgi:type I restriction enzyme R subunit
VGWQHRFGLDMAPDGAHPERETYRQVLLAGRLRQAVAALNPSVPAEAREDAIRQVLDLGTPVLLAANRQFHRLLVTGVPVQYQRDGETRGDFVRLVDWADPARNEWLAVNQFSITGAHHTRRPDIVLFVNGLPLVLIELKNPADLNADVWKAFHQIQTYKAQIADVFQYNEVLVVSDGSDALLGSLSADAERFTAWRTIDGIYDEIVKLRPEWHNADPEQGAIKIVMTGSASDKALLRPHLYSAQVKKRLEKRFKNPSDPLRLVIVRDMWLTGFDAPCVHTLYIDKPMKGHNLMQAIARVNRVFKDKQGGLVVDYIGIANELKSALKEYTASHGRGRPTVDVHEAYSVLAEKLDALRGMLAGTNGHGFDYSGFLTGGHKTLAGAANFVLGIPDGKKRFADLALAMSKAFTLCCTLDEAKAVREEVAFFQAVKVILTKREISARKKADEERELAIRQIISSAVVSEEVVDIFDAVGLDKPNISILDDAFLAEVRNLPERNLAVELLERLLEGEIKSRFAGNVVQNKKFSGMLTDVVQRYQNRSIEAAQVMEELVQMAKKFREAAARGERLGLNEDEVRFYDALANNESAVRELTDETLKKIAHELAENLRKNLTVDWSARESVQAKLRLMVKRILRKYKYPPDQQDSAIELVLKQARALGEAWA